MNKRRKLGGARPLNERELGEWYDRLDKALRRIPAGPRRTPPLEERTP